MSRTLKHLILVVAVLAGVGLFVRHNLTTHAAECLRLETETREILASSASCVVDADCTTIGLSCPFDCLTPVRRDMVDESFSAVARYNRSCMLVCPDCPKGVPTTARCVAGRCRAEG